MRILFAESIAPRLPVAASALGTFRASLDEAIERIRECLPELAVVLTQAIGAQASEPLSAVRGITTLYRMTNREVAAVTAYVAMQNLRVANAMRLLATVFHSRRRRRCRTSRTPRRR